MNFPWRAYFATLLSCVIALVFSMTIGVRANTAYHSAVNSELKREIDLGNRPTQADFEIIEKKYSHLLDPPIQVSSIGSSAFRETSLVTFFVWLICLAGVRRGLIEVIVVAAALLAVSKLLGLLDIETAGLWFAAVLISWAIPVRPWKRERAG